MISRLKVHVGGRDFPHEVFEPWVRWDLGLDRIRSFSVVRAAVVVTALFQKVVFLEEKFPGRHVPHEHNACFSEKFNF